MRTLNKLPSIGFILIGVGLLFELATKKKDTPQQQAVQLSGYCAAHTVAVSIMLTGVLCIVAGTIIKILWAKK